MKFYKMCALGNDFVIVDYDEAKKYVDKNFKISSLVEGISHRKYGIGCDQVIFYKKDGDQISVYFYNADGTEAEMCGNGLRAIGSLFNKLFNLSSFEVKTKDRIVKINVNGYDISTNLGKADFSEDMLLCTKEQAIEMIKKKFDHVFADDSNGDEIEDFYSIDMCECSQGHCSCKHEEHSDSNENDIGFDDVFDGGISFVSMGNPHVVLLSTKFEEYLPDEIFEEFAPKLEKLSCFKNRANVSLANIVGNEIFLRVWERGAGDTGGCGSAACATVASVSKLFPEYNDFVVHQEGGKLTLNISDDRDITVTGDASMIFSGEFCS